MKNLTVIILAFVLVCVMLFAGVHGMLRGHNSGPFFFFLGSCTLIGLSFDAASVLKEYLRKSNVRKLGR